MTTDFAQTVAKMQDESLKMFKQAQDANLAACDQAREMFTQFAKMDSVPTVENLPSPTKFVELSFDYANKFLELRKEYAMRVAELFTPAAKN
jgi:hypothetical protein